jgi:hypothetical protein
MIDIEDHGATRLDLLTALARMAVDRQLGACNGYRR